MRRGWLASLVVPAESIIDDLEADGYINNPGSWDLAPGEFATVYVDVSGPNHEYGCVVASEREAYL